MNFLLLKLNTSFLKDLIFFRYELEVPQFAEWIGFSKSTIYSVLKNERPASIAFIYALYVNLNLSVADHLRLYHSLPKDHAEALGNIIEDYLRKHGLLK
ncbi:hypothetical protein HZY86_01965 [Aerococcaceae bacterium DSM 111020]|nr:hypothetical protein [Aerococcaceae bacterium DSM 111020]